MRRRSSMGAIHLAAATTTTTSPSLGLHGPVVEQIPGLIKVYKDGHVERPAAAPEVPSTWTPEPDVASKDLLINRSTGVWARFYVPTRQQGQLPLLVYFHGGGFCVGSAAWACYHDFLARLVSRCSCIVMSVNYRLAPEHRLPTAYDDGALALKWIKQQQTSNSFDVLKSCDFSRIYLCGDSAGASIAYNVLSANQAVHIKGMILIQPFLGGETRTLSEKNSVQGSKSALTPAVSDCYWRLALPTGSDRDHPYCNPLGRRSAMMTELRAPPTLVCVSDLDILKDRNLEFCRAMKKAGKNVEHVVYAGVGHAFQLLHNYNMSQVRTQELLNDVKEFVNKYR